MKLNDPTAAMPWVLARRAEKMNPSVIREILKVTEQPGIITFAGGLPAFAGLPAATVGDAPRWRRVRTDWFGDDEMTVYAPLT